MLVGLGKATAWVWSSATSPADGDGRTTPSPLEAVAQAVAGFCGQDWRGAHAPPLTSGDEWADRNLIKALQLYQGVVSLLYVAVAALTFLRRPALALLAQLLAMAVLVLRGVHDEARTSNRAAAASCVNVPAATAMARIIAGIALFAAAEGILADAVGTAAAAVHLVFAFGGAVMSDYVCHRFIWHARWSLRAAEGSWDRWMWTFVRGHHIQHYIGHHKHAQNPEADAAMRSLQPVPRTIKAATEAPWANDALAKLALSACVAHPSESIGPLANGYMGFADTHRCCRRRYRSDHGMTIKSKFGALAYLVGYIMLPSATLILTQIHGDRPLGAGLHLAACVIPMCCLMRHDMIHSEPHIRKENASKELFGWLWRSREWDRLSAGHMRHHFDPKAHNRFFSLVPFGHVFLWICCGDQEDGFEAVDHLPPPVAKKLEPWLLSCKSN